MGSASTLAEKPPLPTLVPAGVVSSNTKVSPSQTPRSGGETVVPSPTVTIATSAPPISAAPVAGLPSVSMYTKTPSPSASGVAIPGSTT